MHSQMWFPRRNDMPISLQVNIMELQRGVDLAEELHEHTSLT